VTGAVLGFSQFLLAATVLILIQCTHLIVRPIQLIRKLPVFVEHQIHLQVHKTRRYTSSWLSSVQVEVFWIVKIWIFIAVKIPLPPYAFMAWRSIKVQGQIYLCFTLPFPVHFGVKKYCSGKRSDSSASVEPGYGLDNWDSAPDRDWDLSLRHKVHTGSGESPSLLFNWYRSLFSRG